MAGLSLATKLIALLAGFLFISWYIFHVHVTTKSHHDGDIGQHKAPVRNKVKLSPKMLRSNQFPVSSTLNNNIIEKAVVVMSAAPTPSPVRASKLHAVTYASHHGSDDRFCRSVESAIRNHYDLVILGWKVPWKGLSQKLEAAHQYASSIPPDDLLLFTDAFDVLYTAEAPSVMDVFYRRNYSLLFAGECGCWPHVMDNPQACVTGYPKAPTPYRYLNSGTWIGYAKNAAAMLEEVIKEAGSDFKNANDQKLVADMFISGKHNIALDYWAEIFQSMHRTDPPPLPSCNPFSDMELTTQRRWRNKRTNTLPAVFHFNGGGKQHHLKMEGSVWYKDNKYYQGDEGRKLADHLVSVPSMPSGKLTFNDICGSYLTKIQQERRLH